MSYSERIVIKCPNCGQKLGIPDIDSTLFVTCPNPECTYQFHYPFQQEKILPKKLKWYKTGWFIVLTLVIFTPIGIALLWSSPRFKKPLRIGLTVCFGLLYLSSVLNQIYVPSFPFLYEERIDLKTARIKLPRYNSGIDSLRVILTSFSVGDKKSIPEIATANKPAVVSINIFDKRGNETGMGSGFVLTEDGFIATNFHVVADSFSIQVKFLDGRILGEVYLVSFDREKDLAILKVNGKNLPKVNIGFQKEIEVGESIIVIGNPLGFEASVSEGIVSGINRGEGEGLIQITAPISPGSSGGPVFDMKGEVIGIATSQVPSIYGQNLNFAIPVKYLENLIRK